MAAVLLSPARALSDGRKSVPSRPVELNWGTSPAACVLHRSVAVLVVKEAVNNPSQVNKLRAHPGCGAKSFDAALPADSATRVCARQLSAHLHRLSSREQVGCCLSDLIGCHAALRARSSQPCTRKHLHKQRPQHRFVFGHH